MMRNISIGSSGGIATRLLMSCVVLVMVLSPSIGLFSQQTASAKGCTLVELRPGYPGYQGFVTGVDGVGDHACVEDLEETYSRFSRRVEDQKNQEAANRLGIAGSPDVWTWENWLVIESERGLTPTCYFCAFVEAGNRSQPRNTNVRPDDPRLNAGTPGDTWLMTNIRAQIGAPGWLDPIDDYQFRALVTLVYGDPHLNAEQLLEAYDLYGEQWITESMTPGGRYSRPDWLWDRILERGGYFDMPGNAAIEDQIFVMHVGFAAISALGAMAPDILAGYQRLLESEIRNWRRVLEGGGSNISLGDYLISIGACDWI